MEGYQLIKSHILRVMNDADLRVESTIRELCERAAPRERALIEASLKSSNINGGNTILDLLAVIRPGK